MDQGGGLRACRAFCSGECITIQLKDANKEACSGNYLDSIDVVDSFKANPKP